MQTDMSIAWQGFITATIVDKEGRVIERRSFKNLITDVGLNLLAQGLCGIATDLKVKYVALGTSSTAPANSDTKLGAEFYRKTFAVQENQAVGQMYTQFFLASGEANQNIAELGWFAGSAATSSADSGILIARTLFSYNKTTDTSLYLDRTDVIGRG